MKYDEAIAAIEYRVELLIELYGERLPEEIADLRAAIEILKREQEEEK